MKKITALLLSLVLAVMLLSSCGGKDSAAPMGFKEISDDALTYDLFIPDEWTADLSTGVTAAYYSGQDPSNISMIAFELDGSITGLEDYWAKYEPSLKAILPDLEYVDQSAVTLDGADAMQYIYTGTMSDVSYKFMQLVAIRNNRVYIFTYTAYAAKYDEHIEDVLAILDYFCFTE